VAEDLGANPEALPDHVTMPKATTSMAEAAIRGSALTSAQTILNKIAALAASLVLAKLLDPADYGVAFTATTLSAFLFVLAPWVLNDLLVSRPKHFTVEAGTALAIGMATGVLLTAAVIAGIPWLQSVEPDSRAFPMLLAIAAARPIADAWMAVPWASLRLQLRYGRIAAIDGSMQLAATASSIMLAVMGAGPLALVLPPVAVLFAQGTGYWLSVRGTIPLRPDLGHWRPILRRFTVAAASQYLNNVVKVLELLLLTCIGGPTSVGLFAFAFQLSSQANVVIANQVSGVIQPVLSHINDDPKRQFGAFLRALRLIGCVGVPISIVQAAVGLPVFRLLFGAKWNDAVPAFVALSVMQAFIFLATPIMTLLKAQGRFRTILVWQLLHIIAAAALILFLETVGLNGLRGTAAALGVELPNEAAIPFAAAVGGAAVWGIGCPIALRSGGASAQASWRDCLIALALPWPGAVVVGIAVASVPVLVAPILGGTAADITTLAISIPAGLFAILLSAAPERQCREDLSQLVRKATTSIRHRIMRVPSRSGVSPDS
jgi:O-antigen/teichoic acid export membrane protein